MAVKSKASARGGVLGANGIIDVDACSNALKQQSDVSVALPATTQNTTTNSTLIPIVAPNGVKFIAAAFVYGTAPAVAGGTCTLQVQKVGTDGTTVTNLNATVSALGRTNNGGFVGGAAVSGITVAQGECIRVQCVTSNNAVGTAGANGWANILLEPIEATVVDQ